MKLTFTNFGSLDATYWHSAQGTKEIYLVQLQGKEKEKAPKEWTLSGSIKVRLMLSSMYVSHV